MPNDLNSVDKRHEAQHCIGDALCNPTRLTHMAEGPFDARRTRALMGRHPTHAPPWYLKAYRLDKSVVPSGTTPPPIVGHGEIMSSSLTQSNIASRYTNEPLSEWRF